MAIARFRLSQIGETPEIALKVQAHYQKGRALLKEKKGEEALREFLQVLDWVPKRVDALENAGTILFEEGKLEEASGFLQRVLAIDPNILFAHYLLALFYESRGKVGEAWNEMSTLLKIGEKTPLQKDMVKAREKIEEWGPTREIAIEVDERLKKAGQLYEKEDLEGSEKEYQEILRRVPGNVRAKFGMALIDYKKEKIAEAKKLFLEVVDKDPKLLPAHFFLGKIYLKEKSIQKAFDELSKVVELGKEPAVAGEFQSDIEEARRELAQMGGDVTRGMEIQQLLDAGNELVKNEDFDRAREKFIQVLALSPEHLGALEKLGSLYLRETGFDAEKGEAVFKKMLKIDPALLWPHFQLGFLYNRKGEVEKAISEYQEVIQLDKKGGEVSLKAKKLLVQMGETAEKARLIHRHFKAGEALSGANQLEEAKKEYQKILEIVPDQLQALYLLALIDLNQKNADAAEKSLRRLIGLEPEHLDGHLQLGLILGGRGIYDEAVQELEKVLSLGKEGKTVLTAKNQLPELKKKSEGEGHFKAGMEELKRFDELEKISPSRQGEPPSGEKSRLLMKGIDELQEAIKLNQDNPYYYYNLGYAYLLKPDLISAELLFKKTIEKKPDLLIPHYRLALIYDLAGANQAALKEYQIVAELGKPEDEEVKEALLKLPLLKGKLLVAEAAKGYMIVGESLFLEHKEKEKALPLLKKAVELTPGDGDYWYNLGVLYEALSDEDEAVRAYQQSIKASANFSKPYFYLGLIQEKRGERKNAIENFKKSKAYLVDPQSKEALLVQERINFYERRLSGSLSFGLFNYDSNVNNSDNPPTVAEVSASYGLNLKYFYYKSMKVLVSSDFGISNAIYYYSQTLVSGETASLEAKWPDLHGISVTAGPAVGLNFVSGGMAGWNSQVKADFQRKWGWFDSVTAHFDYVYSVSVSNPFFDSVREDISWTFTKNSFHSGSLTAMFVLADSVVVAQDDSNVSWNAAFVYGRPLAGYLFGSVAAGFGEAYFKNPDLTALEDGLGEVYRKNLNYNLSGSLTYPLFKNISVSGSFGYQGTRSNLRVRFDRDPADILSKQTSPIGGFSKYTLGFAINYLF